MLRELVKLIARGELERDAADKSDFAWCDRCRCPTETPPMVMDTVDKHGETRDVHRMAARVRRVGNEWRIVMDEQGPEEVKLPEDQMRRLNRTS